MATMDFSKVIGAVTSAGLLALALSQGAAAQVTPEQQSAIKSSCRSDFMSKCSGVRPGGADALQCLQKNVASLSPACQGAVSATLPKPAPAAAAAPPAPPLPAPAPAAAAPAPAPAQAAPAPTITTAKPPAASIGPKPAAAAPAVAAAPATPQVTAAQQSAIKSACRSDFMSNCSGVQPGGAQAMQCLQRNVSRLSPGCQAAVAATMPKQAAVPPAAAAAPAEVADAPTPPTAAQMSAIKNTCRGDFSRNCKGVPLGGPEAIACLQAHAAKLSPNCKISLADIGDAVPATPSAPVTQRPNAPVVMTAVIGRACLRDLVRRCRNTGVGDGQKIACLQANEDRLAPLCKAALKGTAPIR